jgi:hypothetical protein
VNVKAGAKEVLLFVDTFNNYMEPDNARAAQRVLEAAGYTVHFNVKAGERPLCCGRTFLSAGLVDEAKAEARRALDALLPYVERGVSIVGLEPSCLLSLRDEFLGYGYGDAAQRLAKSSFLFEEFLVREHGAGRLTLPLKPLDTAKAMRCVRCKRCSAGFQGSRSKRSNRRVAVWRAASGTRPSITTRRRQWPNCRCCPPSEKRAMH